MKKYILLFQIVSISIFIISTLLSHIIFFKYMDYKQDIFDREQEEKMYITELYKIVGKFHFGKRSFGGFGGDIISYHAICDEPKKDCHKIEGVIIKGEYIHIYNDSGFLSDNSDIIFGIFTQDSQKFYSSSELREIPEEQRNILLDLKENPRFIFE